MHRCQILFSVDVIFCFAPSTAIWITLLYFDACLQQNDRLFPHFLKHIVYIKLSPIVHSCIIRLFYLHLVFNKFKNALAVITSSLYLILHPRPKNNWHLLSRIFFSFILFFCVHFCTVTFCSQSKTLTVQYSARSSTTPYCFLQQRERLSIAAINVMITIAGNNDAASKCMRTYTQAISL